MTLLPGATAPDKHMFGAALGEAMSAAAVLLLGPDEVEAAASAASGTEDQVRWCRLIPA